MVRDDLEKFGDFRVSVWRELNTAAEPVSDEDIRLVVNGGCRAVERPLN